VPNLKFISNKESVIIIPSKFTKMDRNFEIRKPFVSKAETKLNDISFADFP
jgi:hypothetical protein